MQTQQNDKSLEIVFIIDKSGSMTGQETAVLTGYNGILRKYRVKPLPIRFTTVFFSSDTQIVHERTPIRLLSPLKYADYKPGDCTALLDAIGDTVERVMQSYQEQGSTESFPPTLVFVMTDGYENASHFYSRDQIKELIKRQQDQYGWQFEFLGAGIDAFADASHLGVSREHAKHCNNTRECFDYMDELLINFNRTPTDADQSTKTEEQQ